MNGKHNPARRLILGLILVGLPSFGLPWFYGTPAHAGDIRILAIGDSLTAGYELSERASFPAQLEARLRAKGYDVAVQNAGVSGDTSAMGLARLDWVLGGEKPDIAILELGANDALRGVAPENTRENLTAIIERLQAEGIPILLAGMMAPRNLGSDYVTAFDSIYPELAEQYDLAFYPFFMEGVIDQPALVQDDGLHPTREGVAVIVEGILPVLEPMIKEARPENAGGAEMDNGPSGVSSR